MKEVIRNKYLIIRDNIVNRDIKNELIFDKIINDQMVLKAKTLFIYVSINSEVDTYGIINYFIDKKQLAVPRIDKGIMNFYYIKSLDELKEGYGRILEPISNNIVTDFKEVVSITPGVVFSDNLYRYGYGGGYYDKFYEKYPDIYKIGITYDECLVNKLEIDKYDIRLDEVITPSKILKK